MNSNDIDLRLKEVKYYIRITRIAKSCSLFGMGLFLVKSNVYDVLVNQTDQGINYGMLMLMPIFGATTFCSHHDLKELLKEELKLKNEKGIQKKLSIFNKK